MCRMGEVDQNLNYMLGQLSLVVQEFNQVCIVAKKEQLNRVQRNYCTSCYLMKSCTE